MTGLLLTLSAAITLLLACVSEPVTRQKFNFVTAYFLDGNQSPEVVTTLTLGMWGYCLTPTNGEPFCPRSALGYRIDNSFLPPVVVNVRPLESQQQLMNYRLAGTMLLFPLSVGQLLLTALVTLPPFRIFSMIALFFSILSLGIVLLSMLCFFLTFVPVKDRIEQYWSLTVLTTLSTGTWLVIAATICVMGAPIFLWMAVIPPKKKEMRPLTYDDRSFDDNVPFDNDEHKSFRTSKYDEKSAKYDSPRRSSSRKSSSDPDRKFDERKSPLDSTSSEERKLSSSDRKSYGKDDRLSYVEDGRAKSVRSTPGYEPDSNGVYKKY